VKLEHLGLDSNPLEDLTGLEDLSTDTGATISLRDVVLPPKVKSGLKERYGKPLDLQW
jgi:hypothetical protein